MSITTELRDLDQNRRLGPTQIAPAWGIDEVRTDRNLVGGHRAPVTTRVLWLGTDGHDYQANRVRYGGSHTDWADDFFIVWSGYGQGEDPVFCGLVHPDQILQVLAKGRVRPIPFYPVHVEGVY